MTNKISLSLAKRAIRNYNSQYVSKATNRRNQRAWLRSISSLGDHWVLAKNSTYVPHEGPKVLNHTGT